MDVLHWLSDTAPLTPHGYCLFWQPGLLWIDALSDGATMLAYFSIPLTLLWYVRGRADLPHRWIGVLFVCFIVACGITHGFSILTLWVPVYGKEALAKLVTACLSIGTAIVLWPVIPQLLALPSPTQLAILNRDLQQSLDEQRETACRLRESEQRLRLTHEALQSTNDLLEEKVAERTGELLQEREALRVANDRLALATDGCGIGIWDWDIASDQIVWDARMFALYGIPPNDAEAHLDLWRNAVHPDDLATAENALLDGIDGIRPFDTEFRVIWRDGRIRYLHGTGRVSHDEDGRPVRMVGTNWDVTERHLAEEMRISRDEADRASRAKSDFLATMSHEIRSPLSALLGVLELLRGTDLDSEQARMAGLAAESGTMLLAVLNDILDFSKIEAGAMAIVPEPVALRPLVADLAEPHRLTAGQRGLHLDVKIDPDLPEWVQADKLRLRQMLGNLLSNALKFTAAGGVFITVSQDGEADSPMLSFTVRDTGIGMKQEVLDRLFRPFTQADGSTTRLYGGTGLGLSISQKLAQLQGGSISVSSAPGVGSAFVLRLPLIASEAQTATDVPQPEAPHAAPRWQGTGRRVLVVDDDPTIRWLTVRKLEKLGLAVDQAVDGAAGLNRLLTEHFDIVLTDCHMPNLDGVGLTRALREATDPALRSLPVLGLTADVTEAQRERCAQAGMTHLAIKPLGFEALINLLNRYLPTGEDAAPIPAEAVVESARPARAKLFDDDIYLSVFERGDPEGRGWLQEFLAAARADCEELSHLVALPDGTDTFRRTAHRLAGASFSAGAMLLGEAARALENAPKDAELTPLLQAIMKYYENTDLCIRGFLSGGETLAKSLS
jgi:signal transduction histidine kinase/CheY-like chemotaxis protein/HPt (histidine-containing phosphotransfer) domain-containing protein